MSINLELHIFSMSFFFEEEEEEEEEEDRLSPRIHSLHQGPSMPDKSADW